MSGESSKKDTSSVTDRPTKTVEPFMPGVDNMIAQQLAAGGYGSPETNLASLLQTYSPMQVPDYSQSASGGSAGGSGSTGGSSSSGFGSLFDWLQKLQNFDYKNPDSWR